MRLAISKERRAWALLLLASCVGDRASLPAGADAERRGSGARDATASDALSRADVGKAAVAHAETGPDVATTGGPSPPLGDAGDRESSIKDAGAIIRDTGVDAGFLPGRPEVVCAPHDGAPFAPESSTAILDATVQSADSVDVRSNGDLWPSCWSGDGLYAAWGDGFGFSDAGGYPRPSIGVARILGDPSMPDAMTGQTLVHDRGDVQAIFKVWTSGSYYQKPTGMLCLPGKIFLAVQDLNSSNYGDAPAATIAVSTDSGETWTENTAAPLFDNHEFTTMMFLDYGQDGAWATDAYVYVYGLDYNWSSSTWVTSPQGLYLARVPGADAVLDRTSWEFFGGNDPDGNPTWTADFTQRLPVLVDCTRRDATPTFAGYTVFSQGSVVYDAPRQRYLYTSWTAMTYEFYESPTPWGPWRKFLYRDFGPAPWTDANNGGYAATIPTKYIRDGGSTMWIQSNSWSQGVNDNNFALRTMQLGQ